MGEYENMNARPPAAPDRGYTPGRFTEASARFLQNRIGRKDFESIMHSADGRAHPYVAARVLLSEADWVKFVWIEHHGSLDGFGNGEADEKTV